MNFDSFFGGSPFEGPGFELGTGLTVPGEYWMNSIVFVGGSFFEGPASEFGASLIALCFRCFWEGLTKERDVVALLGRCWIWGCNFVVFFGVGVVIV